MDGKREEGKVEIEVWSVHVGTSKSRAIQAADF
jgi:hypothetical protein